MPTRWPRCSLWTACCRRRSSGLARHSRDTWRDAKRSARDWQYDHRWAGDQHQAGLAGLTVNEEKSRSVMHTTADPDVFVVEIDPAFDSPDGIRIVSLLKIFRMRDGKIVLLRDYFSPDLVI